VLGWFMLQRENVLCSHAHYAAGIAVITNHGGPGPAAELHSWPPRRKSDGDLLNISVVMLILAIGAFVIGSVFLGLLLKPTIKRWEKQVAEAWTRSRDRRGPIGVLELPRYRGASWQPLYEQYVPPEGQAATVQGELLRSTTRVASEFSRNGCLNWCSTHIQMCAFARQHLTDGTFTPEVNSFITNTLDSLLAWAGPPQSDENAADDRDDGLEPDDDVASVAPHDVEALECLAELWCRAHREPIPRDSDPDLEF
jgi:hypothetical protein